MGIDTIQKDHTLSYTDYSPYTLSWSEWEEGLTNQEKRRRIVALLANKTVGVSPIKISKKMAAEREISSYEGEFKTIVGGLTRVRAYYDGTDNTGEIKIGQPIVFDTVTGNAVTGINEKWTADEFHVVGISFSNYALSGPQKNHQDIIIARIERPKNHHQGVIMAITAEEYAESGHGYVSTSRVDLPIIFHTWEEVDGVLTLTPQSTYALYRAVSPYGWLPPGVPVDVIMQNDRYLILRPPAMLHGVAASEIPTAEWGEDYPYVEGDACTEYTFGQSSYVQIWHLVDGVYVPQEYSNGDPVTMTWYNQSAAVSPYKLLTAAINTKNEWVVIVEPCELECDPGDE